MIVSFSGKMNICNCQLWYVLLGIECHDWFFSLCRLGWVGVGARCRAGYQQRPAHDGLSRIVSVG